MIVIHRNLMDGPIHNNQSSSYNFRDDQDETDVIALVALFNALILLHKKLSKVDVAGAGSAGYCIYDT
jgi:malic enzyme